MRGLNEICSTVTMRDEPSSSGTRLNVCGTRGGTSRPDVKSHKCQGCRDHGCLRSAASRRTTAAAAAFGWFYVWQVLYAPYLQGARDIAYDAARERVAPAAA